MSNLDKEQNFANGLCGTDVAPHEILRRVSGKTLEVRAMDYKMDDSWSPDWKVGGFAGHCANQSEQKWVITSNEDNPVFRIRLGKNGWKDKHGMFYSLRDKPIRFYDFNF